MCRVHSTACIKRLAGYMHSNDVDETISLRAIEVLLSYGFGKPKSQKEISGAEGGPITVEIVYRPRDKKRDEKK